MGARAPAGSSSPSRVPCRTRRRIESAPRSCPLARPSSRATRPTSARASVLRRSAGMPAARSRGAASALRAELYRSDQVWTGGEDRLEIGADAVAKVGDCFRGRRVVAPRRPADDRVAGADGEEDLGGRGNQGGDSVGRRRHGDGIAGIVYQTKTARRGDRRSAGRPPWRAATGAAGEISVEQPTSWEYDRPSPRGEMGVCEGRGPSSAPPTLPRGCSWWRERRGLLASDLRPPSRFPSGVVSEVTAPKSGTVPVTVAGPRRLFTGFRASPFANFNW